MQKPIPEDLISRFAHAKHDEVIAYIRTCKSEGRQPSKVEQLQALIQDARKFLSENRGDAGHVTAPALVIEALDFAQDLEEEET